MDKTEHAKRTYDWGNMIMKYKNEIIKRYLKRYLFGGAVVIFLLLQGNYIDVQAATEKITLKQYHGEDNRDGEYYYELYPNDKINDYEKFLKYTYKISDDSVIGLAINKDINFHSFILGFDENGEMVGLYPYDVKVCTLGPGTATLKVYDGKKLIDSYVFTVKADSTLSPSSFVNNTDERYSCAEEEQEEIDQLLKKFALAGADEKNITTNQRVLAALNATIAHGGRLVSEKEYKKWIKKNPDDCFRYLNIYSRLIDKEAIAEVYASVNRTVLSNLGFDCSDGLNNWLSLNNGTYEYGVDFEATTEFTSDYDFYAEEEDNIYKRTHLPAWVIGEDTVQQVVDVGQTIKLSTSNMNANIFSSDPSIVKAENGKITGIKPGIAIVYRYDDTYCDMFFVLVNKKGSTKTIQAKIYTKTRKSYFTKADYAPYILGGYSMKCQIEDWDNLYLYEMEPIFGHGGYLKTKYSKGQIKCYLEYEGESDLLYTVGSGKAAR